MRSSLLLAVIVLAGVAVPGQAAKVKVWHHHAGSHFEKAQFSHAVVSSEGVLRLSRQLKPFTSLEATHVWDLIEDGDGNLVAATGDDGKIYKITPDGQVSVLHTCEACQVLCLARATDGTLYAGTGPSGHIIRIDPKGRTKLLCDTHESYVWSLVVDPRTQDLYVGTGPKGRVLRVTPDGKCSVYYSTRQEHILCLAVGADGIVYAGTDKGGLVYRIDAKGKGFVLHQAAQSEVRSLKVTADALYVGTSSPSRSRGSGSSASKAESSTAAMESVSPVSVSTESPKGLKSGDKTSGEPSSTSKENSKGSSAPAPSAPSSGENSVYRIALDGTVREVFREKALVLSVLKQGDRFFVGTGMEGRLFEVDETTRERSEIARLDHGQILCLCRRKDGAIVLGTGDPGKLYLLHDKYTARGTVTSEVLDAKLISKWGALGWEAETPEGTSVTVAARSGNVAEPDDTWSDWSAEQTNPEQAVLAAPTARFLQYRVTLRSKLPMVSPLVRGISLRYMTTNLAPEVTKVEVPDLNAVNLDNPKKLKIKWNATDANEDELAYAVYIRKEGWKDWVLLEDDLDKTDYEWDTTTTPSGIYRVKIVATDRKDNAEADALTAERPSVPFVVCHEAPGVSVKVSGIEGDQAVIEATATSPLVRLTSASFAVNGKKWINVFPTDGLFDARQKTFKFKTEGLKPGTYVLVLRVRDASGNLGSSDVVFTVPPPRSTHLTPERVEGAIQ
jgi:outer membrane protein assembly factor BamB